MFKSKKKIKVFSDVYNLAGDIKNRPNFLKTVIIDQALFDTHSSYGTAISSSYQKGPGIKLRQLVPAAQRANYYSLTGQSTASINKSFSVPSNEVKAAMEFELGVDISVYDFEISGPDIEWWGRQFLMDNHPERVTEIYGTEVNDNDEIVIEFFETDEGEDPTEVIPTGMPASIIDASADYLCVLYGILGEPGQIDEEDVPLREVEEFYDVSGWGDPISNITEPETFEWEQTIHVLDVYPAWEDEQTFTVPRTQTEDVTLKTYKKTTEFPASESQLNAIREIEEVLNKQGYALKKSVDVQTTQEAGFTRTTTTTDYSLVPAKYSSYNKKTYEVSKINVQKLLIYKRGSGIQVFEDLFKNAVTTGHMYPVIPVRYDVRPGSKPRGIFIDSNSSGSDKTLYSANVKLLNKVGERGGYEDILDSLKSNSDIKHINYAYVMYGASLNTPANSARKYIFEFFKTFGEVSPETANQYQTFEQAYDQAHQSRLNWVTWRDAQLDPEDPLYGTQEPVVHSYPSPPTTSVRFRLTSKLNLDYTVKWNHVTTVTGSGRLPDYKVGEVKVATGGLALPELDIEITQESSNSVSTQKSGGTGETITFTYQKTKDSWEALTVYGLGSSNIIYKGKGVFITSHQALADTEESGLIIPIHETVIKNMRLVDITQFGASSSYLMLNYFSVTKTKWYQTSAFKIVIIIVIIIISIYTGGAGGAAAGSSMGAVAATAIGLTGAAALVFAAAVNAIVGMIVSRLITKAATAVFGDKIGIIIGAVVSMVAVGAMNSYASTGQVNLLDSFNANNLLKLTTSIAGDLSKQVQQEVLDIGKKMEAHRDEFQKESDKLTAMFYEEFGDQGIIDVTRFLESGDMGNHLMNNPSVFLERTLLTGSDIANISLEAIGESLKLDYQIEVNV